MLDSKTLNGLPQSGTQFIDDKLDEDVKEIGDYELNDQLVNSQSTHRDLVKQELQTLQKFTGFGDAEQWLTSLLEKFELLQVDIDDRIKFVPGVLTGEAFIWYIQHESHMSTFISFAKAFLQRFSSTKAEDRKHMSNDQVLNQHQFETTNGNQEDVFSSLRNQFLLNYIEKLPKFSGRSGRNGYVK